jgi:hypothetical protein
MPLSCITHFRRNEKSEQALCTIARFLVSVLRILGLTSSGRFPDACTGSGALDYQSNPDA